MKKRAVLWSLVLAAVLLCACSPAPAPAEPTTVTTEPATSIPTTEEPHTGSYIPGVPVEDVIRFFSEVCLDAEFTNSGDPSFLQKWESPIVYQIHGTPTQEDLLTLTSFASWLNTIPGFPGITEAKDPDLADLHIHFCSQSEMCELMGDQFYDMDGAVTFWYQENVIYDAIICCRTDLEQDLRNSVILEELYNSLGPIQDTVLRPDSIIYSEFSQPQSLTPMDELILKLLYHPDMRCGMTAAECEAVIRDLYR